MQPTLPAILLTGGLPAEALAEVTGSYGAGVFLKTEPVQELQRAIARHTTVLLKAAQDGLRSVAQNSSSLLTNLTTSDSDPSKCQLTLQLGRTSPVTNLVIEPFTGRLCIRPITRHSPNAEHDLNRIKNPMKEITIQLEVFLCFDMLNRIQDQATINGWEHVQGLKMSPDLSKRFNQRLVRHNQRRTEK